MAHPTAAEPCVVEVAGQQIVWHRGDPDADDAAMHTGALLVDRSHRSRMIFPGPRAAAIVTGLVTNDVAGQTPGHGCYAAALTPKGKIIADVRVFVRADGLLVDVPPRAAAGWTEMVRKYVNPRQTAYRDVSARVADLGLFGAQAARIAGAALEVPHEALLALPLYGHIEVQLAGLPDPDARMTVARVPDAGVDGFELFVETAARAPVIERLAGTGATMGGLAAFEIGRVEAGRPEWGLDIDDSTIPQEANFDELNAISYTKGCYTGQETVARLHFRGHVNRQLRGLRMPATGEIPPLRASLVDAEGKPVGDVRSSVRSPRLGPIALAMVRREVPIGAALTARWGEGGGGVTGEVGGAASQTAGAGIGRASGSVQVTVAGLPFTGP